uniref:NADP dependent oxidoreductase domain containing 1 n=1 Tax=Scophthalmus maximus TaxID=52904 RepID=A0A8D3E932_SCOMX
MEDVAAGLKSLSFESGLGAEEKELLHLRARAAGLAFCRFTCAGQTADRATEEVSTRRPELPADGKKKTGVECFFDNSRLAAWADVLFLCCLPFHLPKVCAELRSHLSEHCLVYSFISAVPVTRLAELLGHNFILKPQYDFVGGDTADVWLSCTAVSTALKDPLLIDASCPLAMSGKLCGISLSLNWACAVLYTLLNICTSASLRSSDALSLINELFQEKWMHAVQLNTESFISSSYAASLRGDE